MEALNSVLIEGVVTVEPGEVLENGMTAFYIRNGHKVYGETYVRVDCEGYVAKNVYREAHEGTRVRVVGRLINAEAYVQGLPIVRIMAEHVEVKK